jgi:hypothetical protein
MINLIFNDSSNILIWTVKYNTYILEIDRMVEKEIMFQSMHLIMYV